ncbi:MAG: DUF3857 domain-containing protein [Flavobacteriaceae bacterium]|nr:DUF3857 domain-containing protein [Flavobacteriaceae bacterium]
MVKKITLTIFAACLLLLTSAQEFKMSRVTLQDVNDNTFTKDTSANALFLYKWRKIDFEQNAIGTWETVTKIHERIKILKKRGVKEVSKAIVLKNDDVKNELIDDVKIVIYYNENGKLKSKKIDESELVERKLSITQSRITFDFSAVEAGSIIDINYTIHSPFYTINDLIIQEDIPINHLYARVSTPSFFHYRRTLQGNPNLKVEEDSKEIDLKAKTFKTHYERAVGGGLKKFSRDSVFQATERISEYETSNIKALKKENYAPNLENHRWLISYDLQSTDLPDEGYKDYSISWDEVIKEIYNSELFSEALSEQKFFKSIVPEIENDSLSQKEMVYKAFNYVKDKLLWNKGLSIFPENTLQNTYSKQTGNVADVNLFLVSLLKACGFKAYPILATTKNHPIRRGISQDAFNYVLAYVELDYEDILLDATSKNSMPNILPERVLDTDGTLIYAEDDYRIIDLFPKETSQINTILNVEILEKGKVLGSVSARRSNMDALDYRNKMDNSSIEKYIDSLKIKNKVVVENFKIENLNKLDQPIIESYDLELQKDIELNSDKVVFSPLFFLKMNENPFKNDERSYPINFGYKHERKTIVSLKIPEGFEIKSLPQSVKISLPENIGYYQYQITRFSNTINLVTELKVKKAFIPTHLYLELKTFFDELMKKELENIVIIKIN